MLERGHWLVHQRKGNPFAAGAARNRAVMRGEGGEAPRRERAVGEAVGQGDRLDLHRAQFAAIAIEALADLFDNRLGEFVDRIDAARRVHPADVGVEALIDEELAPGRGAIGVQPLVARHLLFGAEEEAGVRIDQQQCMAILGARRGDGDAVGPLRLAIGAGVRIGHCQLLAAIKGRELAQIDAFDVAANRSFGECERHPRLEMLDHARADPRVGEQIIV